jgi:hypothetical protein
MTNITQEQVFRIRKVQRSGETNMFDISMVSSLGGLTYDTAKTLVLQFNNEYEKCCKEYSVSLDPMLPFDDELKWLQENNSKQYQECNRIRTRQQDKSSKKDQVADTITTL